MDTSKYICAAMLLLATAGLAFPGTIAQSTAVSGCFTDVKWSFCYNLDEARGQGLELYSVSFDGTFIFYNIGVPFSMTRYEGGMAGPYKDILGQASSTVPGYGLGAVTLTNADCPRFLGSGTLYGNNRVCYEKLLTGKDPRVFIWSKFNVYNYQFIASYELRQDGTFLPKVLLGGTLADANSGGGSTSWQHQHYIYWRMDIDMNSWPNDKFQEFTKTAVVYSNQNTDAACPASPWCTLGTETFRDRGYATFTKWRQVDFGATNSKGHPKSIEIMSDSQGAVDPMSTHDVWAVRYKCQGVSNGCEMGYQVPANPTSDAPINAYASGESINGQDIVVWYSHKVHHEPRDEETPTMAVHEAGPIIKVRNVDASNPGQGL
jgi:hypothetical protein